MLVPCIKVSPFDAGSNSASNGLIYMDRRYFLCKVLCNCLLRRASSTSMLSPKYKETRILNTDQVGIEKEQYSRRTLSYKGERKTFGVVESKHATTHSYTVQPTISLDRQLIDPMYLCLQEPGGKMDETVKKRLFQRSNVVITCSESNKLTSSLVRYWCEKCLGPLVDKECLLLSDSYLEQNDPKLYQDIKSKSVQRIMIPKNTTCDIQPLDRYFNRQMKILSK